MEEGHLEPSLVRQLRFSSSNVSITLNLRALTDHSYYWMTQILCTFHKIIYRIMALLFLHWIKPSDITIQENKFGTFYEQKPQLARKEAEPGHSTESALSFTVSQRQRVGIWDSYPFFYWLVGQSPNYCGARLWMKIHCCITKDQTLLQKQYLRIFFKVTVPRGHLQPYTILFL